LRRALIVRSRIACVLAAVVFAPPALAQLPGAPSAAQGAEAHILSAFTTRADPRVFADSVVLGPRLRSELGEASGPKVYQTLIERTAGKALRSRKLSADEAARVASLPGIRAAEPIVLLQGGEVLLLLQYAPQQFNVAFVEQLEGAAPAVAQAPKVVEPPAPPPAVVEVAPVPPPPPAPTVVKLAPAAAAVQKKLEPAPTPVVQKPAAPAEPSRRPKGPCMIKPVMSDDDLYNCGATPR
jgi:hypothetical protein